MPLYRCYFLDRQDHIQAAENIEAERLDMAVDCAHAMLRARPQHHSLEVWQGALRLYCSRAQAAQHQCHIYDGSPSETLRAMAAMIERKLRENVRCMYLNSPPMVAGLKTYLTSAGVNLDQEIEKGSLVLSSEREHLARGEFDADLMLGMLENAVDEAERDGYRGLWATGDMTWELGGAQQSIIDVLDYEWRLEKIFQRRPALSGVCQYHMNTLPQGLIRQGYVAHSSIFVNETLSRINPHYLPPGSASAVDPELDLAIALITEACSGVPQSNSLRGADQPAGSPLGPA